MGNFVQAQVRRRGEGSSEHKDPGEFYRRTDITEGLRHLPVGAPKRLGGGGGGKEAYALAANSDRTSTNPGDALKELFNRYSPCLILIDEWVAYARLAVHRLQPAGGQLRHAGSP